MEENKRNRDAIISFMAEIAKGNDSDWSLEITRLKNGTHNDFIQLKAGYGPNKILSQEVLVNVDEWQKAIAIMRYESYPCDDPEG